MLSTWPILKHKPFAKKLGRSYVDLTCNENNFLLRNSYFKWVVWQPRLAIYLSSHRHSFSVLSHVQPSSFLPCDMFLNLFFSSKYEFPSWTFSFHFQIQNLHWNFPFILKTCTHHFILLLVSSKCLNLGFLWIFSFLIVSFSFLFIFINHTSATIYLLIK